MANGEQSKSQQVDDLLNRLFSPSGPGAAVMVIADGKIVYNNAIGVICLDRSDLTFGQSIASNTNFRLASLTKQFTAMGIAILTEQNGLDLDGRLATFFPGVLAKNITIRRLLHHTSGLREYDVVLRDYGVLDGKFYPSTFKPTEFQPTNDDVIQIMQIQPLESPPSGSTFKYNNAGYIHLASIIEKCSGMSYGDFLNHHVFEKLEMNDTRVSGGPGFGVPHLAHSYRHDGAEFNVDIDFSYADRVLGHDGVFSNLNDLYKWDQALCRQTGSRRPPRSLVSDEMLETIFASGTVSSGAPTGYGFGWSIGSNGMCDHSGDFGGYNTYIRRYRDDRFTVIVLSNQCSTNAYAIGQRIDDIYSVP